MNEHNAIIPRQTLAQMAEAYQTAESELKQAFELLASAKQRLELAFNQNGYRFDFVHVDLHGHRHSDLNTIMREVKKDVWRSIIDRMELKRILSVAESEKMDRQIETGEGLPEITFPNLLAMLEGTLKRIPDFINQAVKEVFDYLRPSPTSWRFSKYKTAQKSQYELAAKHIISFGVEYGFGPTWHVNYHREQMLRAIDNVFHTLDGKGTVHSTRGPLVDTIAALPKSEREGTTLYFRFKVYRNQNLHLEFLRLDLLAKLNEIAGGMALKPQN